jgi:hypothetical protein
MARTAAPMWSRPPSNRIAIAGDTEAEGIPFPTESGLFIVVPAWRTGLELTATAHTSNASPRSV